MLKDILDNSQTIFETFLILTQEEENLADYYLSKSGFQQPSLPY